MNIPTGTVTFLFTDIEGSTKLSQDYPETYHSLLTRHNEILQKAVESNNGFVFKTVGDAFCCAFQNAQDAVKAAVDAQIKLNSENGKDAVIKLRTGIHSGNAEWNGKDYMGYITLARTARVMSAAYGEQIIISNDAYELSIENISDAISFRDLGERRLKDVIQPIRLFQIIYPGLREDFPPLKTLDARPNNLPIQLTSFIGRENEMKEVKEQLGKTRLLTIIGSGGAGKTRLALQTGADMIDDFSNGVFITELAPVSDPSLIVQTLMDSIGIKEEPGLSPKEMVTGYLKDLEILIIFDNCEHLIKDCADLVEFLLRKCPRLKIITTTRESLNCSGEHTYRVPSLSMPDTSIYNTPEKLTQYEAVRLFIERALLVKSNFRINNENAPALAEICSRLDGIPLAIELAAARVNILTVDKINERLDDRFKLLSGGKRTALPRQQTLKALIDWSYDLLTENEKNLWSRVSVFTGGWTLEAAEEVCSDDTVSKDEIFDLLSQLAEKSVVIYDEAKDRYRILESIKQYGVEKLSDGNEIYIQHLNYFLELSKKAEPELKSKNAKFWLAVIEADYNNFISAIEWSVNNENKEKGAVISNALGRYWNRAGLYSTGIRIVEIILESPGTLGKLSKGNVLYWIGSFKMSQGDNEQAKKYLDQSLEIYNEIGNKIGIALSLQCLGNVADAQGDFEPAKNYFEESLAIKKEIGDKNGIASPILSLGNVALNQGDYEQAKKYYEESLYIFKEIGHKYGIALSINNLGNVALYHGDYEQAKKYLEESLGILKEIGNKKGMGFSLETLGNVALNQGDYEQAKIYYEESLDLRKEIGDKNGIASSILSLGMAAFNLGSSEQAKKFYEESLNIYREIGDKNGIAESINRLGCITFNQGDYERAKNYYEESLNIYKEIRSKSGIAHSINYLGNAAFGLGDFEKAIKLLSAAEKSLESMGAVLDKDDQKIKDENIAKLKEQFSEEEFTKYWEEGSSTINNL